MHVCVLLIFKMLHDLANNLPLPEINQYDLEKQDASNSQNISIVKRSLFSLQRTMKIVLIILIMILISLEGADAIMKLLGQSEH